MRKLSLLLSLLPALAFAQGYQPLRQNAPNANLKVGTLATVGNATIGGKLTSYNGTATKGMGVSPIYAYGAQTGITTNTTTIATFTPSTQGVFEVGGHLEVTAYTSGNVGLRLVYTDCQGNAQSLVLNGENNSGSTSGILTGTGSIAEYSQTICANAASITLQSNSTGTATTSYWAFIRQVN